MASLTELFQCLSLSDDKMTVLSQIRNAVSCASNEELWLAISNLPLSAIYENINSDDNEQLEYCCVILDRLFSAVDVNILLTTFGRELILGLSHKSPAVNEISLNQVARVASANVQQFASYLEVLQKVANLIASNYGNVTSKACRIFITLGGNTEGLELIFHNQVFPYLTDVMSKNDVVRYRVYEMIVDIASLSIEALTRCSENVVLQSLVNDLNKDDVMIQLNCLELLSKLCLCDHGFQYLDMMGAFGRIENLLITSEEDSVLSMLIMPGIFKFFGGICYLRPKDMCARFEIFMKKMFSVMNPQAEVEPALTDVALESIGLIGSTPDGKMALEKYSDFMVTTCHGLGRLLTNAPGHRRSRVLNVISQLIHLEVANQTTEILTLTKEWFDLLLESDPLKKILDIARQPFAELHVPGLQVIKSLAGLPWGQEYLNSQPGFEEYLLDRKTETTKEGMEKKYEIVRTLANSPTTSSIFSTESVFRLKTFESQGPFYAPMQSMVALESS